MTDLQVWNMTLNAGEITEWSDRSRPGNVIDWQSAQINNRGLLLVEEEDEHILQESPGSYYIVLQNCLP